MTSTKLLCQQLAWHLEDLELHCDKERRDKTTDRYASLTVLKGWVWLMIRAVSY